MSVDSQATPPTQPAAAPTAVVGEAQPRRGRSIPELAALVVLLIGLVVFFSIASEHFLSANNILNILTAIAVTGILAAPGTILLISGQVDLSVGSAAALCGVVMGVALPTLGLPMAIVLALFTGLAVGAINGVLVTVIGVNSLIVTLGGLAAFRGAAFLVADGQTVLVKGFSYLGSGRPFANIPMPVILLIIVGLIIFFVLKYTVYGRQVYAIGANPVAARLVGIRSGRVLFIAFLASGLGTAIAGLILTSQLGAAVPNAAQGMELTVVTAIVLGGASLSGGRGSVMGTLLGLMIIGVLNNGLTLMNTSSYWQQVASGVLLIAAVSFDRIRERLSPAA